MFETSSDSVAGVASELGHTPKLDPHLQLDVGFIGLGQLVVGILVDVVPSDHEVNMRPRRLLKVITDTVSMVPLLLPGKIGCLAFSLSDGFKQFTFKLPLSQIL